MHQLDVKTAFLNGELEEEMYIQQSQGYEQGGPNTVCRLLRALYELRQAPRAWHRCLKKVLEDLEFVASSVDATLFRGTVDGETIWLLVWVDDILVAIQGEERVAKLKAHLTSKFDVRDLGPATYFLAMELSHDREARSLKLTQKKLTGELISRYGLVDAHARSVPLATGEKLRKEGEPLDTVRFPYSECVGKEKKKREKKEKN
jgi:histone deacetylase 1/2